MQTTLDPVFLRKAACVVAAGLGVALTGCTSLPEPQVSSSTPAVPEPASQRPPIDPGSLKDASGQTAPTASVEHAQKNADSVAQEEASRAVSCAPPVVDGRILAGTNSLVAFSDRLHTLGAPELAQEISRLSGSTDSLSRLKLALALGQVHQAADTTRAISILQRVTTDLSDPEAAHWGPIAHLFFVRFLEQRKLEEQLDRQGQQMREDARRIDGLNHKINALRAIERSLNTRPLPQGGGATPRESARPGQ